VAAALTLASGALMMLAGYIGEGGSWTAGGLITVPAGVLILLAFVAARRAQPAGNHGAPDGGVTAGAMIVTLLSGGIMVLAGYAWAAWGWAAAAALASLGGLVILAAFALGRRPI
jgi:hypothetical protein